MRSDNNRVFEYRGNGPVERLIDDVKGERENCWDSLPSGRLSVHMDLALEAGTVWLLVG